MARLIKKFASTLGASQRANVSTLLSEGSISGEIKSYEEFKAQLEEFASSVNLEATPLFKVDEISVGKLITSSHYNNVVRLLQLDLETVYTEVDNVIGFTDTHRELADKKIKDIKDSIAALDSKISTLELLAKESDYNLAQFNTFDGIGNNSLSKSHPLATSLYYDTRESESLINSIYETVVDVTREGLVLPVTSEKKVRLAEIALEEGTSTTESDLDVDPGDNELSNIFEENDDKFWVRSVLLLDEDIWGNPKALPTDGVTARIRLELSGLQEVNTIKLTPFTDSSFTVTNISYVDVDNIEYSLVSTDFECNDTVSLTFDRVIARRFYIDIKQASYTEISDFYYSSAPESLETIQQLATTSGLSDLEIGGSGGVLHARGYLYTMGFDFIGLTNIDYLDKGIYVSEALTSSSQVTELAVRAGVEHSVDSSGNPLDSVEFYIAKYNYDASGLLVRTEFVPVQFTVGGVDHEELILTSGLGATRLLPDLSSLEVYRDFTLLTLGTEYTASVNGQDFRSDLPTLQADVVTGLPPKLQINITTPLVASTYTVSYTPTTTANSNPVYLNADATVEFQSNSLRFYYLPDSTVDYCDIYTVIVLRSFDYSANRESPTVLDYVTKVAQTSGVSSAV